MTDVDPSRTRRRRLSLKQEAANYIRDLIFSGKVRAGERLDQDGIAAALEVSRLPIREALITLEAEGMVTNVVRRGAFVAALEPEDILDHFRMYGLLSGIAAERVAEQRPPEVVERLTTLMQQMRASSEPAQHDELNYLFHKTINRAGGSRRLISVLRILANNMPSNFFASNTEWEFREQTFAEHEQIVTHIREGEGKAAAEALAKHFVHTGEQAVRHLEAVGFWAGTE
ncbi:GntR family transcriptional regulator [Streptomyces tremellae]|uniref:GntR family transcriptional regulator n=1 Tax=Streptomyces tremellae TaxID=1124239 RepID=A0ABP7F4V1_9ACTN